MWVRGGAAALAVDTAVRAKELLQAALQDAAEVSKAGFKRL